MLNQCDLDHQAAILVAFMLCQPFGQAFQRPAWTETTEVPWVYVCTAAKLCAYLAHGNPEGLD